MQASHVSICSVIVQCGQKVLSILMNAAVLHDQKHHFLPVKALEPPTVACAEQQIALFCSG